MTSEEEATTPRQSTPGSARARAKGGKHAENARQADGHSSTDQAGKADATGKNQAAHGKKGSTEDSKKREEREGDSQRARSTDEANYY